MLTRWLRPPQQLRSSIAPAPRFRCALPTQLRGSGQQRAASTATINFYRFRPASLDDSAEELHAQVPAVQARRRQAALAAAAPEPEPAAAPALTAAPATAAGGAAAGGGSGGGTVVSTEAKLRQAVAAGGPDTVVLKAGSRIVLTGGTLEITRTVRLVGEGGGALPAIAGVEGREALRIIGAGVSVELEGLRIEGRDDDAINCLGGSSLLAVRCELTGRRAKFCGKGTRGELRECAIVGSKGHGLFVGSEASVVVDGGAVRGCAKDGVVVFFAGSRVAVRYPTLPRLSPSFVLLP